MRLLLFKICGILVQDFNGDVFMRIRTKLPLHPGNILKYDYLEPLSLSITRLAKYLGVSRQLLSNIVNERSAVTPDIALRLSRAFKTSPALWLNMQKEYDLWHAQHASHDWEMIQPLEIAFK
jgi:addiction module HigA family antidote